MMIRIQRTDSAGRDLGGQPATRAPVSLLGKAMAVVAGGLVLVAALFVSAIVFSVLLVVGVVAGGWFWWRTRHLRRQVRDHLARMQQPGPASAPRAAANGDVIDGDYVREAPGPVDGDIRR